ncbi:MAG: diguanylate cyclase, partial [Gammaproteobacteria bacterium SHHR-1]
MSLNRKILAVIIGILSVFLLINTSLTTNKFRGHYTDALLSGSFGLAHSIEGMINEMLALGLPLESLYGLDAKLADVIKRNPHIRYIGIGSNQGEVLFHSDPSMLGKVLKDQAALRIRDRTSPFWQLYDRFDGKQYYDISVPLFSADKALLGTVRLGFETALIENRVQEAINQTLLIALVSFIGMGLLLKLFLSHSIIRRIRRLSDFARAITQGDFPPQQVSGRDEIGELANSLREMGATIQGQIHALQRAGLELEERVEQRTAELALANATLEASNRELSQALSREQALSEALRESEERFRMLFEQNKAVMLVLDPDSSAIIDANFAAADYYGYSRERLRQMKLTDISALSEQETQREIELARREQREQFFFRHTLASGKVRDVEVHSGPVHWQGRTLLYAIVHDITLRKQAESKLERMAHYDALTGLPNRLLKTDRLRLAIAASRRKGSQLAVCYLDLDGFKPINDIHGHDVGDQLLVKIAQRLEESLREGDTVSRIGGDEFVL